MRKQRILEGALEVLKVSGLDGATMDQIAQHSGFGKQLYIITLNPKEDVFSAILEDGWITIWESCDLLLRAKGVKNTLLV